MPDQQLQPTELGAKYRSFLLTTFPAISLSVISVMTDFVATWILSKSDENGLAAAGLFSSLRLLLEGFVYGFLLIVAPLASGMDKADEDYQGKSSALFHYGLLTSLILSIPMTLVYYYSESIFLAEGQNQNVSRLAGDVFRSYSWGAWADASFIAAGQYAMARNEELSTFAFLISGKVGALVLAYYWVLGSESIMADGSKGLGEAYSIFSIAAVVAFYVYLLARKSVPIPSKGIMKRHVGQFRDIFKNGWPVAVYRGAELSLFAWMIQEIGRFSVTELSAAEIVTRYASIPVVLFVGLSQAISVSVSSEPNRVKVIEKLMNLSFISSTVLSALCCVLFLSLSDEMSDFFIQNYSSYGNLSGDSDGPDEIKEDVFLVFIVAVLSNFFDGPRTICSGHLRGRLDTTVPMVANVIQSGVFVGLSYLLMYTTDEPALAVFLSRGVSIFGVSIFLGARSEARVPICKSSIKRVRLSLKNCCTWRNRVFATRRTTALTIAMVESRLD